MHTSYCRRAYTVLDLLVAAALGIVLAGLTIRGVASAQDAAALQECKRNLRQIAIACHNYHADYNRLPAGYWGPLPNTSALKDGSKCQNVGSLLAILPYLEQDQLYRGLVTTAPINPPAGGAGRPGFDFGLASAAAPWWSQPADLAIARTAIKVFRCPADAKDDEIRLGFIRALHTVGTDMECVVVSPVEKPGLGRTNYVGVAGCLGAEAPKNTSTVNDDYSRFTGLLHNRSKISLGQVTALDGTSNTLMIGEGLGGRLTDKGRDFAWSWMGVGGMWTFYGMTAEVPDDKPPSSQYRFGSRHKGLANFAWGDGSVRSIRFAKTAELPTPGNEPKDWTILQQLAGYRDGLDFDTSKLVE